MRCWNYDFLLDPYFINLLFFFWHNEKQQITTKTRLATPFFLCSFCFQTLKTKKATKSSHRATKYNKLNNLSITTQTRKQDPKELEKTLLHYINKTEGQQSNKKARHFKSSRCAFLFLAYKITMMCGLVYVGDL